jgi:hypothetical protein
LKYGSWNDQTKFMLDLCHVRFILGNSIQKIWLHF